MGVLKPSVIRLLKSSMEGGSAGGGGSSMGSRRSGAVIKQFEVSHGGREGEGGDLEWAN